MRIGHNRLTNPKIATEDAACRKCSIPSLKPHVFFECNMNKEARRNLESTMIDLGYNSVTLKELLSPPPKHINEVVKAVITFLNDTDYLDILC